ncbi:hypothetical protein ACK3Q8_004634, partial [Vibrio parahaemolyticus]
SFPYFKGIIAYLSILSLLTRDKTGLNAVLRSQARYLLHREPNQMDAALFDLNLDDRLHIEKINK